MARKALLIGISNYINKRSYQKLLVPPVDVKAMKRVLENRQIGFFDEVIGLYDLKSQEMREQVEAFFRNSKPNDTLLLYFSGHCDLDKHKNNKLYFATQDSEKDQHGQIITAKAVDAEYISQCMSRIGIAHKIILIIDACYSGAFRSAIVSRSSSGEINLNKEEIKKKKENIKNNWKNLQIRGSAILTSSSLSQKSYEPEYFNEEIPIEPSLFTGCIVESLESGEADINKNGEITISELFRYIKPKVEKKSLQYGERYKMTPQIEPLREGYDIIIAKVPQNNNTSKIKSQKQNDHVEDKERLKSKDLLLSRPKSFKTLEKFLTNKQWRQADEETLRIILHIAKISVKNISNLEPKKLPKLDIKKIDQLWLHYSHKKFGFSIQKEIWLEYGEESDLSPINRDVFYNFGKSVGWYDLNTKRWKRYDQLHFSEDAEEGHLPSLRKQRHLLNQWEQRFCDFLLYIDNKN